MARVLQADPGRCVHLLCDEWDPCPAGRRPEPLLVAPVVGFVLAVASHVVPDGMIREQLAESIARDQLNVADDGQAVSGKQIEFVYFDILAMPPGAAVLLSVMSMLALRRRSGPIDRVGDRVFLALPSAIVFV